MRNLAELQHHVYAVLRDYEFRDSEVFRESSVNYALRRALDQIRRDTAEKRIFESRDTQSLTADTALYDLPSDLLDTLIADVLFYNGSTWRELPATSKLGERYESDTWYSDPSGYPESWMIDPRTRQLRLHPTPSLSQTNGLVMDYVAQEGALFRIWGTPVTSTLTVAVTNGSTAATLSSAATDRFL